jgi:hypothetical protein
MNSSPADWITAVSSAVMALSALAAIFWSVRELELRRDERRQLSEDKIASDILYKAEVARSTLQDAMLRLENNVRAYLDADRIAFGTFEAGFSVMDNLNGTNDAYQAFSGALRVGRAIWGEQFAVFEKAVHTAHFDLLFWSICCDGVFRAPPEDNQLTDAEWETRRSHFNETMLAFVKAMDQLSGAISQYLLAKRLQSPQSI